MVLYSQTLGGSAMVVGIIVGMMPLPVIFQIPASNYLPRIRYRRFLYVGERAGSNYFSGWYWCWRN